jgi:eukaryotic-like serine/threonine-protein kinase
MELRADLRVGRYRLVRQLGRGGMGVVWSAHDDRLDRPVAIKFIAPDHAMDPAFREDFEREARAVSRLDHPNILTVLDFGDHDEWIYMVSPMIGGGTLAARLKRGPWSLPDALAVIEPLASALDYAHSERIVHRDVTRRREKRTGTAAQSRSEAGGRHDA